MGLPATSLNVIYPDGPPLPTDPNNAFGWAAETTLDVSWAHAIAPAATIDLVVAKSNNDADILSATQYVADHNLGDVVSQSFGEAEQCMDSAAARAAAQGLRPAGEGGHHALRLVRQIRVRRCRAVTATRSSRRRARRRPTRS